VSLIDIEGWHQRLQSHFRELSSRRRGLRGNPVFALEHGLSSEQVDELQHAVRMSIAHDRPRYKHYLPWAVYAAEIG